MICDLKTKLTKDFNNTSNQVVFLKKITSKSDVELKEANSRQKLSSCFIFVFCSGHLKQATGLALLYVG